MDTADRPPPRTRVQAAAPADPDAPDLAFLAPPERPDELGRLGPYRILGVLGAGGMGLVLAAEDPHLRRRLAVKVMLPYAAGRPAARERFLREARAAAGLEHDNVVPVFGTGEDRGVPYIAMPLLKGMSLEDYLTKRGELSIGQTLRIGREAARGLAAAHARGLVHRDVKPANLWLDATARGRVKILDFGLARLTEGGEALTADGAVLGTPAYMAPEQAAGDPATPASDLFSLGAVLYRLAAGRRPFTGHTPYAAFASLATETPVPVRERNPAVPEPLADLIAALLDKDPSRRPGSAADVADALAAIERERRNERHDPATGRPPEPSDAQLQLDRSGDRSRAVPRRQAAWAWAAAGLAAAAAGSAAMAAGWR